ncbi:L-lactate dehydrogenase [Bacillus mexicanus]|uniref:L-lactate dehydrogenase n=1 Tax=Bacillus mexicanus TaxID=2834415 RepID=UPI003D1EF94F
MIKSRKTVIIGTGFVGSSAAYSIVNKEICDELVLIDVNAEKAKGEALDLSHCADFLNSRVKIKAGEYEDCKDADIVVITAGAAQKPGQTRLDLLESNMIIMKVIVSNIMNSGFDGLLLVASNPADVISYIVWKLSGLPKNRVIGTGTSLDSSRLKVNLSDIFNVDPRSINGFTLGEHGDSQFVPWSSITIGTKSILEIMKEDQQSFKGVNLDDIENQVRKAAYEIIEKKGSTYYGIGAAIAGVVRSIFNDEHSVRTVSTLLQGEYGHQDIFTSVPAVLTSEGVKEIIQLNLNDEEKEKFSHSCKVLKQNLNSLKLSS